MSVYTVQDSFIYFKKALTKFKSSYQTISWFDRNFTIIWFCHHMVIQQNGYWNLSIYLKLIYIIFSWSISPLISSSKIGTLARVRSCTLCNNQDFSKWHNSGKSLACMCSPLLQEQYIYLNFKDSITLVNVKFLGQNIYLFQGSGFLWSQLLPSTCW